LDPSKPLEEMKKFFSVEMTQLKVQTDSSSRNYENRDKEFKINEAG